MPLLASAAAYWAFLSLIPALVAVVAIYGLVTDPARAEAHVRDVMSTVSPDAQSFFTSRVSEVSGAGSGRLGLGLVVSLGLLLWTASSGVHQVTKATAIVIAGDDGRSWATLRLLSLAGAVAGVVLGGLVVAVVTLAPAVLDDLAGGGAQRSLAELAQWVVLLAVAALGASALYRWAPAERRLPWKVLLASGTVASVVWLVATWLVALYVQHVARSGGIWGALGGIGVALVWLWVSANVLLAGGALAAQLADDGDQASR